MNLVQFKSQKISIPSEWKDITERDLLFLGQLWPLVPTPEKMLTIFFHFLQLRKNWKLSLYLAWQYAKACWYGARNEFAEQIDVILAQLDHFRWLWFENNLELTFFVNFEKVRYKGASKKLENLVALEFAIADGAFVQYMKNNTPEMLDLLVATIWRPIDASGRKETFSEELIEERLKKVALFPSNVKNACLLSYMGQRNLLIDSPTGKKIFKASADSSGSGKGWGSIIMEMSGDKFGNHEQTAMTPLHHLLFRLIELMAKK
jgi:hypothetical protein